LTLFKQLMKEKSSTQGGGREEPRNAEQIKKGKEGTKFLILINFKTKLTKGGGKGGRKKRKVDFSGEKRIRKERKKEKKENLLFSAVKLYDLKKRTGEKREGSHVLSG